MPTVGRDAIDSGSRSLVGKITGHFYFLYYLHTSQYLSIITLLIRKKIQSAFFFFLRCVSLFLPLPSGSEEQGREGTHQGTPTACLCMSEGRGLWNDFKNYWLRWGSNDINRACRSLAVSTVMILWGLLSTYFRTFPSSLKQHSTFAPFESVVAPPGLHFGDAVLDVCFGEAVDSLGCQAYWVEVVTRDGLWVSCEGLLCSLPLYLCWANSATPHLDSVADPLLLTFSFSFIYDEK